MKTKTTSRVGASAPEATKHLTETQKKALDTHAEAEHADGPERERLTREIQKSAEKPNKVRPAKD